MDKAPTVIPFPRLPPRELADEKHPIVKSVTEVLIALGDLAQQIEKWPMDPEAKSPSRNS